MYSYEQKMKAIKMLTEDKMDISAVEKELGIPSRTLYDWMRKYNRHGELPKARASAPKFSREEKIRAVNHYMVNGKNYSKTCQKLGYPTRQVLKKWVEELAPEEVKQTSFTLDEKLMAVDALINRNDATGTEVAEKLGIRRETLYGWKAQYARTEEPKKKENTLLREENKQLEDQIRKLQEENKSLRQQLQSLQK